jgi:hypothetical protein
VQKLPAKHQLEVIPLGLDNIGGDNADIDRSLQHRDVLYPRSRGKQVQTVKLN